MTQPKQQPAAPNSPGNRNLGFGGRFFAFLRDNASRLLALVVVLAIGWLYLGLIETEIVGFTHDDGVYAIVAKALASGEGFTLLHVVGQPAQVKYPFLYPALLTPIWWVFPSFPENLAWMGLETVLFTVAACWVLYLYLSREQQFPGWLALLVVVLVSANFFFMYFFSMVMAEAPYLFFSLLTLLYFHRRTRQSTRLTVRSVGVLVLLSVLTFHTRVLGLTLMGAIGVWLLLHRQWRNAMLYGAGSFLLAVLPWTLWIKTQTPPLNALNYPLVTAYNNYGLEFAHNYLSNALSNYPSLLSSDFSSLMHGWLETMFPVIPNFFKIYPQWEEIPWAQTVKVVAGALATYVLVGYFVLQAISALGKSMQSASSGNHPRFNPDALTVPGLYTGFYLIVITLWSYEAQMARFLTVISPLLWMFFLKPFLPALRQIQWPLRPVPARACAMLALVALFSLAALWPTTSSYRLIWRSRNEHWVEAGQDKLLWREYQQAFSWIRNALPEDARLAATSDAVFYLYTGRQTFYTHLASLRRANGQYLPESFPLLMDSYAHYGVDYLVAEPHMQQRTLMGAMNPVARHLVESFPERFQELYHSPRGAIRVYRIRHDEGPGGSSARRAG